MKINQFHSSICVLKLAQQYLSNLTINELFSKYSASTLLSYFPFSIKKDIITVTQIGIHTYLENNQHALLSYGPKRELKKSETKNKQ